MNFRLLLALTICFSISACASKKVTYYSDGTYLARLTVAEVPLQRALKSSIDEMPELKNPIMKMKASFLEEDLSAISLDKSLPGDKYDYWVNYDPVQNDNRSMTSAGSQLTTKPVPLGEAWDKSYTDAENYYRGRISPKTADGIELTAFEPNIYSLIEEDNASNVKPFVANAEIVNYPSEVWGYKKDAKGNPVPNWHFSDDYSQLDSAKNIIAKMNIKNTERVLIAHLDTGFNSKDKLLLLNRENDPDWEFGQFSIDGSKNFYKDECDGYSGLKPEARMHGECPGHGTKTLSVLSGGEYKIDISGTEYSGTIGANPYANVVEYRIKDGVVHFNTTEMAAAINYAVKQKADVISLSAGGLPGRAQRDAVNYAYENGVAIFAATGDFFKVPFFSISTPSMVGYPARYSRVMAVAGTTYDYKSYGEDPYPAFEGIWKIIFGPGTWSSWMMRGNFGPASAMYPGKAVSGYAPNIMKSEPPEQESTREIDYAVSLDGSGTSHSTPQVAGAAAIWLQMERENIVKAGKWNSWEKAESVYRAVSVCSADSNPGKMTQQDFSTHFGAGHLKATTALNYHFPSDVTKLKGKRAEATIGYTWIYDLLTSIGPVGIDKTPLEKLHASMMLLEALQFATIDKGLSDIKETFDECLFSKISDPGISCQHEAEEFLTNLEKYPELSNHFRNTLQLLLKSKDKISSIAFEKDINVLKKALKATDPNRCDLEVRAISI